MESASDPFMDLEGLDAWLASAPAGQPAAPHQTEAPLPAWLQEVLEDANPDVPEPPRVTASTTATRSTAEASSSSASPSGALEKIRRKNRLAQQRSRKRRNDHVKELEDEVRRLTELLEAGRQRNGASASSTTEMETSQPVPYQHLALSQHRLEASRDEHGLRNGLEGSPYMSHLLASLADGTFDDRFFPLLGKHFGNSDAYRQSVRSPFSALKNPDAAISWLISFTSDSNNFARAASARQMSIPSAIVIPELVLYKVCRFYFRLLLPFSTSYGSGMVNLNAAKLMTEPEMVFTRSRREPPARAPNHLGEEGTLPELIMPTRMQRMVGSHPIEIAVIPFASLRDKLLLTIMAMNGRQGFELDGQDDSVVPDNNRIYEFSFNSKPNSGHAPSESEAADRTISQEGPPRRDPLSPAARKWLDTFMVDFVSSLRVWNASDDCFNTTAFELRPEFVAKYGFMLDADIIKTSNFWRRSRGEPRLSTG